MLQMDNAVQIAAGVCFTLAIAVGIAGGWWFWDCYEPVIYAPILKCVAILLVTIFWVLVLGAIGVGLSQVRR